MNIDEVREWDAADLEQRFNLLRSQQDRLASLQDELDGARNPEGWTGPASEAAADDHRRLAEDLRDFVAEVAAARKAVAEAADAIPPLQRELGETEDLAYRYGFTLAADGRAQNHHITGIGPYGANYRFGTDVNTILGVSTGCHLTTP